MTISYAETPNTTGQEKEANADLSIKKLGVTHRENVGVTNRESPGGSRTSDSALCSSQFHNHRESALL